MAKAPATKKKTAAKKAPTKKVTVKKAATKKVVVLLKLHQKLRRLLWLKPLRRTHSRRGSAKAPPLIWITASF